MIMVSRINKDLVSITLEISTCAGQFVSQFMPHIATMPEPVVTVATCTICVVLFFALLFLPDADDEDDKSERDIRDGLPASFGTPGGHLKERPTFITLGSRDHEQSPLLTLPNQT